jgi:hypothetical protein
MAWNLIDLIKASGNAATAGQSFRTNVKPFTGMDGKSMTSYRTTGIAFSGAIPALPGEVSPYNSGHVFSPITADITRGGNAFEIQSLAQSAWDVYLLPFSGTPVGMSASISSLSQTNSGESFDLGIQVIAPRAGTPIAGMNVTPSGAQPSEWGDPWSGNYVPTVSSSASGTTDLYLHVDYRPDLYFNPLLRNVNGFDQGWLFRMNNRNWTTSDLLFRAWYIEAGADSNNNNGRLVGNGPYPWVSYGPGNELNENTPIWWRWSSDGGSSWSAKQGPVAPNDTRQPA